MRNGEIKISLDNEVDDEEKKAHRAIFHSLIDSKEELLRAVLFGDLPKIFSYLEEKMDDRQDDFKFPFSLAIRQNDQCISHLLSLLQRQQEKRSPNFYHFCLLFACIFHNKPKLFNQLSAMLKTNELSDRQVMQLYWLALYSKQAFFYELLPKNGVRPLPGVIRLAYFYSAPFKIMEKWWESLVDTEKKQFVDWIFLNAPPNQTTLESLDLPDRIKK